MGEVIQFPKRRSAESQVLQTSIESLEIEAKFCDLFVKHRIQGEFHGVLATLGTEITVDNVNFGQCTILRDRSGNRFLNVHDSYPFALEDMNVETEKTWECASLYARLIDHYAAYFEDSPFKNAGGAYDAKKPHIWSSDVSPRMRDISRLSAAHVLSYLEIPRDSLYLSVGGPYPAHIAAFLDPADI